MGSSHLDLLVETTNAHEFAASPGDSGLFGMGKTDTGAFKVVSRHKI